MTDTLQQTDIFKFKGTPEDGFTFAADNDSLTIAAGVLVGSADQTGVVTSYVNNVLVNNGIVSGYYAGFNGAVGSITNNSGAIIIGQQDGTEINGNSNSTITNHGTISGLLYDGITYSLLVQSFVVNNDGDIYGHQVGVFVSNHPGTISNTGSGLIHSDKYGIELDGVDTTSVSNSQHATISGATSSIYAHDGSAVALTNFGMLVGSVVCTSTDAHDVIVNGGTVIGSIDLGSGNDTYSAKGAGLVTGVVHGGAGNDRFVAGRAKDVFFGDSGADTFVFNAVALSPPTTKHDVIGDFNHLEGDKIDVHAIDADITQAGHQHFVFIGSDTFAHFHSLHPGVVGMLRFDATHKQLQGNVNADFTHADFEVALPGVTTLHAGDLILA